MTTLLVHPRPNNAPYFRDRQCDACGKVETITSKVKAKAPFGEDICEACIFEKKGKDAIAKHTAQLSEYGYTNIKCAGVNDHGKYSYTVNTPCCNTTHTMVYNNINTMVKKNGKPPCPACGGKERIAKAMAGYMELHARTYDLTLFDDYASLVRGRSETTFRQYKHILDPDNTKTRSHEDGGYHLDHKMSIRKCFEHSIPPDLAGSLLNLILIDNKDNLTKSANCSLDLRDYLNVDISLIDPAEMVSIGVNEIIEIPAAEVMAEHVKDHLDKCQSNVDLYQQRRVDKSIDKEVKAILEMGYDLAEFTERRKPVGRADDSPLKKFYRVTAGARTEELHMQQIKTLNKMGVLFWPLGEEYSEYIHQRKLEAYRTREITDEERINRARGQIGNTLSDETKAKLVEMKKGNKRWYHPDHPSFKQSQICPGPGWTLDKPLTK